MRSMSSTVNVARDWLGGMGQGAENQNFSIQCEQTTPRISVISLSSGWRSDSGFWWCRLYDGSSDHDEQRQHQARDVSPQTQACGFARPFADTTRPSGRRHQRLGADYLAGSNTGQWDIGSQVRHTSSICVHADRGANLKSVTVAGHLYLGIRPDAI